MINREERKYMKKKQLLALGLSLIMMTAALTGCSSSSSTGAGTTAAQTTAAAAADATTAEAKTDDAQTAAQDTAWPERNITLIIPSAAGGDTDFCARAYSGYMEKALGKSVVIVNYDTPAVGFQKTATAAPDGYTCMIFHDGMTLNYLSGSEPYSYDDFAMAGVVENDQSNILVVRAGDGHDTLADFISEAKEKPGDLTVAVMGGGMYESLAHLFSSKADVELNIVDGGGGSNRTAMLLGGQVDAAMVNWGLIKDYVQTGQFIALGVFSEERVACCPDVPTMKEQGVEAVCEKPYYLVFPKGTDEAILEKANAVMMDICNNNAEYQKTISDAYGLSPYCLSIEDSEAMCKSQTAMFTDIYNQYMK